MSAKDTVESYPFRSQPNLALTLSSHSTSDVKPITISRDTRNKFRHHIIPHRRPKKLRHPLQTTDPVSTPRRWISASNLSTPTSSIKPKGDSSQQTLKSNRKRFKLPSLSRLIHWFGRKSDEKSKSNTSTIQPRRPSTGLRRLSELLY